MEAIQTRKSNDRWKKQNKELKEKLMREKTETKLLIDSLKNA